MSAKKQNIEQRLAALMELLDRATQELVRIRDAAAKKNKSKPVPPIIEYSDALIAKEEAKRRRRDRALQAQLKRRKK